MNKPLVWFEIPALDLARAKTFYKHLLGIAFRDENSGPASMAVFPYDRERATGGCLMQGPSYRPGRDGAVVYLNAGDSLDAVLNRVAEAGGSIALPQTALPPSMGVFAHIVDSEGNRVGLHAAA